MPLYERYALPGGTCLRGPAILRERESTLVVARAAEIVVHHNLTIAIQLPNKI